MIAEKSRTLASSATVYGLKRRLVTSWAAEAAASRHGNGRGSQQQQEERRWFGNSAGCVAVDGQKSGAVAWRYPTTVVVQVASDSARTAAHAFVAVQSPAVRGDNVIDGHGARARLG